jgi:hypothetical protein
VVSENCVVCESAKKKSRGIEDCEPRLNIKSETLAM